MATNDIIVQRANVTSSMKLCNTKLCVNSLSLFCCTIPQAAYCGHTKCEWDALHRCSIDIRFQYKPNEIYFTSVSVIMALVQAG